MPRPWESELAQRSRSSRRSPSTPGRFEPSRVVAERLCSLSPSLPGSCDFSSTTRRDRTCSRQTTDRSRPVPPTPFEWFKRVALAAFLCVLTYGTWLISVWWLCGPAVMVGGFLAGAGLFVLGATIADVLGIVNANAGSGTREE